MSNTTKKRWGDRKDARWIRDMDSLHVILPHLMNHRTDAEVYVNMEFDVTEALRYIARKNEVARKNTVPRFFTAFLWLSQKRYIFARSSTASSPADVFTSATKLPLAS